MDVEITKDLTPAGANGAAGRAVMADAPPDVPPPVVIGPTGARRTSRMAAIMADPVAREAVRRRYEETRETVVAIAEDIGVSDSTLKRYAKEAGWIRLPPIQKRKSKAGVEAIQRSLATTIADAGAVTARLLRSVDRQIRKIDGRLMKRGSEIEEKDSRILGHLARTLATLMALDRDGGATAKEPERVDRDAIRESLKRRLLAWTGEGEGSE
jgi:hypothetical protein